MSDLILGTTTSTDQPIGITGGLGITLPSATTSLAGLMSADDKAKMIKQGGNAFGTAVNIGTTDGNSLNFKTSGNLKAWFDVPTTNFYVVSLANQNTVNNSLIRLDNAGTQITRNVADGNAALTINQANNSSTGNIATFQFFNSTIAQLNKDGQFAGSGIRNFNNGANAEIDLNSTGTVISRNVVDSNSALTVNQKNASSTGNTLTLQKTGIDQLSMNSSGVLKIDNLAGTGIRMVVADSTGALSATEEVSSGIYNPTITGSATSYTGQGFRYTRIRDIVHVSGIVVISGGPLGQDSFNVPIPIPSTFTNDYDASGVVSGKYVGAPTTGLGNYIIADSFSGGISVFYYSIDTSNRVFVEFTYSIQ